MRSPHLPLVRRRLLRTTAVLASACALALAPVGLGGADQAWADKRSDAQQDKQEAQRKQAELMSSLEGVSAELGQAYLDLQAANSELQTAESDLAARQREAQAATDRLGVAQAQLEELDAQAAESEAASAQNRQAISSMVVSTYQGDSALTSWTYVLASDSVEDLTERASTMEVASGIQEAVLASLDEQRAKDANRQARQEATTKRVTTLKEAAEQAEAAAQSQRDTVAAKQAQAQAATDALEERKASEEAQLRQAQADEDAASAEIARIDAENRAAAQAAGQTVAPAGSTSTSSLGSGAIGHPIAGALIVTSPFNPNRLHPVLGYRRPHEGVDLAASVGTPQYAAVSGTVIATNNYGSVGCGREVKINGGVINGSSVVVRYCHLSAQQVSVGQRVTKGQQIGLTGATGGVTGPHCHFEVWLNGVAVNPMSLPGF